MAASIADLKHVKHLIKKDQFCCLKIIRSKKSLAVPCRYMGDIRVGVKLVLNTTCMKYSDSLEAVVISYSNIKLLEGIRIYGDYSSLHVHVEADIVVFEPKVGSCLKGTVEKIGNDYIGVLVHGMFNASIPHDGSHLPQLGQAITLLVTSCQPTSSMLLSIWGKWMPADADGDIKAPSFDHVDLATYSTSAEDLHRQNSTSTDEVREKKKKKKKKKKNSHSDEDNTILSSGHVASDQLNRKKTRQNCRSDEDNDVLSCHSDGNEICQAKKKHNRSQVYNGNSVLDDVNGPSDFCNFEAKTCSSSVDDEVQRKKKKKAKKRRHSDEPADVLPRQSVGDEVSWKNSTSTDMVHRKKKKKF